MIDLADLVLTVMAGCVMLMVAIVILESVLRIRL